MTTFRRIIELPQQFGHLFRKRLAQDGSKNGAQRCTYANLNGIYLGVWIRSARHVDPHFSVISFSATTLAPVLFTITVGNGRKQTSCQS
jgi:hypothetical protein